MNVLAVVESKEGKLHKQAYELLTYGRHVASLTGGKLMALLRGNLSDEMRKEFSAYGAQTVFQLPQEWTLNFDPLAIAKCIAQLANANQCKAVVLVHDFTGKAVAPVLSAIMKGSYAAGAIDFPKIENGKWLIPRNVFSGKARAYLQMNAETKIISLLPNSIPAEKKEAATVFEEFNPSVKIEDSPIRHMETVRAAGAVSLTDAEIVVSAGRGMKGPENWAMIEEMAGILGAATACSRPVADVHWRPHSEHVGQTGLTVRPNLYIAIGISGAIQHLAGVNGSKVIVVINKDAEAPFFKAADYGIVGDAFEIVPKLNEAFRRFKAGN
jgi:electron transfer flavoprotein alpha subunit